NSRNGNMSSADAVKNWPDGRGGVYLVRINVLAVWVIDGKKVELIDVINLAHLVGDLKEVVTSAALRHLPELDQLFRIGRRVGAVRQEFADRRGAEDIREEPIPASIPDVQERTRACQALRLANVQRFVGRQVDAVLHDCVGPRYAHNVQL